MTLVAICMAIQLTLSVSGIILNPKNKYGLGACSGLPGHRLSILQFLDPQRVGGIGANR